MHEWHKRVLDEERRRSTPTETDVDELIAVFRARRKEFALTRRDLSYWANVSPRFIFDLEKGKRTVQLDKVLAVAAALRMELRWEKLPRFNFQRRR